MTTIYLIRHAQVHNPRRVIYGHLPGFHLSRRGRAQARHLAGQLRIAPPSLIYTSPLERTRETAEIVRDTLARRIPIVERDELRENELARLWQGTPSYILPIRFPGQYRGWLRHPERVRFTENAVQIASRMNVVIEEIASKHPGESVLIVSHATPIKAWFIWKRGLSWKRLHVRRVPNARGYTVTVDGRGVHTIHPFRGITPKKA